MKNRSAARTVFTASDLQKVRGYLVVALLLLVSTCSGSTHTVATYNVHYFSNAGATPVSQALKDSEARVIALQEVLVSGKTNFADIVASQLGLRAAHSSPYVNYGSGRWVLSILSAYPIIACNEAPLGYSRLAFRCTIALEKPTDFVTLHLTPFTEGGDTSWAANRGRMELRKREIADLLKFIGKPTRPTVILGDFNMLRYYGGEYDLMDDWDDADSGFFEFNRDTFPVAGDAREKVAAKLPRLLIPKAITLDYIFLSRGVTCKKTRTIESQASDHYPLIATIQLEK
ncbi:MAG: endonuclease/exonuclease/phosphatase family protein [Leptospirales bacterium]|nr:endonuclease/exonuclease/phosphatase family protein [Leptospirales bacterium]